MKLLNKIKNQKGIGFLEMIAALGVIVTGVIGGMTLTTYNLVSSSSSEDRLLAANLAREAVEVVRNKRDSNWLAEDEYDWYEGIIQNLDNNYRLTVSLDPADNSWDFTDQTAAIAQCDDCRLYYHPGTGVFSHDPEDGQLTMFRRLVTLRQICWEPEVNEEAILDEGDECSNYTNVEWVGWQAEVEVAWSGSTGEHNMSVIDRLYDWK